MLPNIDPAVGGAANVGGAAPAKRTDMDKAMEAYRIPTTAPVEEKKVNNEARETAQAPEAAQAPSQVKARRSVTDIAVPAEDKANIAFQMTREEREVFVSYVSGVEEVEQMSEQEQRTLERVSERLERLIENAESRSEKGRSRMNVALKEWYSRLSGGAQEPPERLVTLIQRAAAGFMDDRL